MTFKISPAPLSDSTREFIRVLSGYYRGKASITKDGVVVIAPKEDFNVDGFLTTMRTSGFTVEKI